MKNINDFIQSALDNFNQTLSEVNAEYRVRIDIKCRKKKFYLNKDEFYERRIAEMSLFQEGKPTLLLWRKELQMPEKVAGVPQHRIDEQYTRELYQFLFFEAVGIFANYTYQSIVAQDYAEYDIEKDRLKNHPSVENMEVQATEDGPFYAKGNKFDVFTEADGKYAVYTAHDLARRNNGIATIPHGHAIITKAATPKIVLLNQL